MTWTADMMMNAASGWDRDKLLSLWSEIRQGDASDWPAGKKFEYLVIRAFQLEGIAVRWPYLVTLKGTAGVMEQFDGAIHLEARTFLIESKNLSDSAAIEALAKLRFRLERRPPGTMGLLFSVSGFSLPAETFAQYATPMNVLLWSGGDVDYALPKGRMVQGLEDKMRHAIEFGVPLMPLGGNT